MIKMFKWWRERFAWEAGAYEAWHTTLRLWIKSLFRED